jgi:hypothetical protein
MDRRELRTAVLALGRDSQHFFTTKIALLGLIHFHSPFGNFGIDLIDLIFRAVLRSAFYPKRCKMYSHKTILPKCHGVQPGWDAYKAIPDGLLGRRDCRVKLFRIN